jgi:ATP-dependent Clp protease ATP-binding subunit ClpB
VVLFDEIEKAHPEVFNSLLQILDDGRMTDGHGRTVDFKNTIIIMTSNVGSQYIQDLIQDLSNGRRDEMEKRIMESLRAQFKPEFLNRIDDTIIFHNLTADQIAHIVDIQMKRLAKRLTDLHIELSLENGARAFIAGKGYDPIYGARPLKRAIQQYIENPLSMDILEGKIREGDKISAVVDGDRIQFKSN